MPATLDQSQLTDLKNERASLLQEAKSIKDAKLKNGVLTEEQGTRIEEIADRLDEVVADIDEIEGEYQNQLRDERLDRMLSMGSESQGRKSRPGAATNSLSWGHSPLGAQLSACARFATERVIDPRFRDATGMNTQTPSDGGFLVGADTEYDLVSKMYGDKGSILSRVRPTPLSANSNTLKVNQIKEDSRADGSRGGGVLSFWEGEGSATTLSQLEFELLELSLKKLFAYTKATEELLEDHAALESELGVAYEEEMTFKVENALIHGTGGKQPTGILKSGALIEVAKEAGQTAATPLLYDNIVKMSSRLHPRSQLNAVWLVDTSLRPYLETMTLAVGAGGVPVYLPPNGAADAPFGTVQGRPVFYTEHTSVAGTLGDIILADFSQVRLIHKGGVNGQVSTHVAFLTAESVFRWTYRLNAKPRWNKPLTPKNGGPTLSPFVALQTRS